jgi:thymidylate synthase
MHAYLELLQQVRERGTRKADRTGTGTLSVFGRQLRFDLTAGFPLVTTKRVHTKSVIEELLWFLRGETSVRPLQEKGVSIWNEWADESGELGPVYGRQWRAWATADGSHVDQVARAIQLLRQDPDSRRIIVSAWNVGELDRMALAPCHAFFQCYVADGRLSLQVYQRSCDIFLGVPFNIASYALLTHILAQQSDLKVGELVWTGGDCHLYLNHVEQADIQLAREPGPLPTLALLRRPADIADYRFEDFQVLGYEPQPAIKAPVAV